MGQIRTSFRIAKVRFVTTTGESTYETKSDGTDCGSQGSGHIPPTCIYQCASPWCMAEGPVAG